MEHRIGMGGGSVVLRGWASPGWVHRPDGLGSGLRHEANGHTLKPVATYPVYDVRQDWIDVVVRGCGIEIEEDGKER